MQFIIPELPPGYKELIDALYIMGNNDSLDFAVMGRLHREVLIAAVELLTYYGFVVITREQANAIGEILDAIESNPSR